MIEIDEKNLPEYIKEKFLAMEIEITLKIIRDAGLAKEFYEYVSEVEYIDSVDDLFEEFGKKYSNKFKIIPKEQRYNFNKTYIEYF